MTEIRIGAWLCQHCGVSFREQPASAPIGQQLIHLVMALVAVAMLLVALATISPTRLRLTKSGSFGAPGLARPGQT